MDTRPSKVDIKYELTVLAHIWVGTLTLMIIIINLKNNFRNVIISKIV